MSHTPKLAPLLEISRLLLDTRLAALDRAAQACAQSRARLAELDRPATDPDLPLAVAAQAALRYEHWADVRRMEINRVLARQTADWLAARDAARLAFGRAEALRSLAERKQNPRR